MRGQRSRDEGFAAEDEALADLLLSDELRAGLYAFDLVNKRAKRPAGAPDKALARPVTKVGIVGAGLMAAQIALLFVRRLQVPVVMTDLDQARVDSGVAYVRAEIDKQLSRGRLSADAANRQKALVTGSVSKEALRRRRLRHRGCLRGAFRQEAGVRRDRGDSRPETACSPPTRRRCRCPTMAAGLAHPERVVGFHFFNPVAVLPLVEVVRTATNDAAVATALAIGKTLKKNCVIVADRPAFVVNRLLTRFLGEITRTVDEGTPFEVAEHAADPLGLPMTPFLLLQLVGPAIALHVARDARRRLPRPVRASRRSCAPWRRQARPRSTRPDHSVDPGSLALLAGGDQPVDGP